MKIELSKDQQTPRTSLVGRAAPRAPFFPSTINQQLSTLLAPLRPLRLCVKILLVAVALMGCSLANAIASTNDITSYVQRGLFEEEANHNLDGAMQAYQSAVTLHDKDRKLVATAIFRLGECLRKEGKTNEANAYYQRVVTEFGDQQELATLARQYLPEAATGSSATAQQGQKPETDLDKQLRDLSMQTAQAEALWKHVASWKRFNNYDTNQLIKFFTTVQPDQTLIDFVATFNTKAAQERVGTLVWGLEQKYEMLKAQEDALKARLGQRGDPIAKANESPTTSAEDEEIRKIKEMIQDSPDLINAKPDSGSMTPLQSAAASGHLKVAEYLIVSGANINPKGMTPLMYAAEHGHNAMVEFLLSKGANVDAVNNDGRAVIHFAAQHGFKIVIETLLKHHARVNVRDFEGKTPLWYAADLGSKPIIELLLADGADVDAEGQDSTSLLQAVRKKHPDCVELLVANKANVNFKTKDGYTPLLAAAENNDLVSARNLLDHGAAIDAQIPAQLTGRGLFNYASNWEHACFRPINFAILNKDAKFVELLLQYHANPNSTFTWYFDMSRPNPGTTPLIMTVRHSENPEPVKLLLDHGANINGADEQGATALHYAAQNDKTNLAEILLQHAANVDALDKNHETPLFYAINQAQPDMVALLIRHHSDVNITDAKGFPPLYRVKSVLPGTFLESIREQLLKAGANENFVRLKQISVRYNGEDTVIFTKGSNDWNHYTVLELLSVVYGKNEPPVSVAGVGNANPLRSISNRGVKSPGGYLVAPVTPPPNYAGGFTPSVAQRWTRPEVPFPDFAHVKIKRISNAPFQNVRSSSGHSAGTNTDPSKPETEYNVNVNEILLGNDVDLELEWGDIIEIPEQDHPINAQWGGLTPDTQKQLMLTVARNIQINVKGTSTNMTVLPPMPFIADVPVWLKNSWVPKNAVVSSFGLRELIQTAGVLRSSSDTTHIKITRNQNSNSRSIIVDLYEGEEPWIEPGDTIEIPDRVDAAK